MRSCGYQVNQVLLYAPNIHPCFSQSCSADRQCGWSQKTPPAPMFGRSKRIVISMYIVITFRLILAACRSNPNLGRRRRTHFPSEIPHGLVREVDDEMPLATGPQVSLVEEISPAEKHHVSRAKADLQLQLRKFQVSTLEVSEVKDASPSPMRIRSIAVGE